MDFSQMNIQQLLEYLKTQSPRMYDALSTPVYDPEEFPFYDPDPMSDLGFDKDLMNTIGRGYDPNLMVEDALRDTPWYLKNDYRSNVDVLRQLRDVSNDSGNPVTEFPSDSYDPLIFYEEEYPGTTVAETSGINRSDYPAAESANFFNRFSDEDLLKLLNKKKA